MKQHGFLQTHSAWVQFLPAGIVWTIWIFTVSSSGTLGENILQYWPASLTMIVGSFIAGSTPLGGGVVAFPLSVLFLKFTPQESRDVAILIQAVGMNAAAFLLLLKKRELLHAESIVLNCFFGGIGAALALAINPAALYMNILYTVLVFEFGLAYLYRNVICNEIDLASGQEQGLHAPGHPAFDGIGVRMLMCLTATVGGFFTGSIGTGSDIAVYVFGICVWNNVFCASKQRLSDNSFTATSVVVQGVVSAIAAAMRALNGGFDEKVVHVWAAMAVVVVVGAPVGSLVLTPAALPYLRAVFYVLAIVQLLMFGIVKIGADAIAWGVIGTVTFVLVVIFAIHHYSG